MRAAPVSFATVSLVALLSSGPAAARDTTGPDAAFRRGLELFERASEFREAGRGSEDEVARRFRDAAGAFVSAWRQGGNSTEVLTNAANSYYFAGDIGEAVLYYRRALGVAPSNDAARDALEHIREGLPIRRKASSVTSLSESLFFWHDERFLLARLWSFYLLFPAAWILFAVELARKRWRWIHALLVPVFPLALLAYLIGYLFGLRRPYATVGFLCLIPSLAALGSLVVDAVENRSGSEAVILVEVQGRNGNGESYSPSHTRPFPPGTEVEVRDRREGREGAWVFVELLDGSTSWIAEDTLEYVIPRLRSGGGGGGGG